MTPHQENSSPGPHQANRLENKNKQSAPVTWKLQQELPGKRKAEGQPKNKYTYFSVCPAAFRCALCAQHASKAGCPEAVDCVIQLTAGSYWLLKSSSIRHSRVQGGAPSLVGFGAKPHRNPLPVKFLFCDLECLFPYLPLTYWKISLAMGAATLPPVPAFCTTTHRAMGRSSLSMKPTNQALSLSWV